MAEKRLSDDRHQIARRGHLARAPLWLAVGFIPRRATQHVVDAVRSAASQSLPFRESVFRRGRMLRDRAGRIIHAPANKFGELRRILDFHRPLTGRVFADVIRRG